MLAMIFVASLVSCSNPNITPQPTPGTRAPASIPEKEQIIDVPDLKLRQTPDDKEAQEHKQFNPTKDELQFRPRKWDDKTTLTNTILHTIGSIGLNGLDISMEADSGITTDSSRQGELKILIARDPTKKAEGKRWWTPENAMTMCCAVLAFGVFVMVLTAYLGRNEKGSDYNKFNLITLSIIASIFLVVAGYDEQQIIPVMGLLGTIVGYVLGISKKS
jgi:hypothetical protein